LGENSKKIKVTDRRMFTVDGDLREEYKELKDAPAPKATADPAGAAPAEASQPEVDTENKAPDRQTPTAAQTGPIGGAPDPGADQEDEPTASGAAFYDLVALLAQTASVYLNQAAQQLVQHGELLEMSRMHIDLLSVLERKTRGNLSADEKAMLEDAIYRLRMALVEIGG